MLATYHLEFHDQNFFRGTDLAMSYHNLRSEDPRLMFDSPRNPTSGAYCKDQRSKFIHGRVL